MVGRFQSTTMQFHSCTFSFRSFYEHSINCFGCNMYGCVSMRCVYCTMFIYLILCFDEQLWQREKSCWAFRIHFLTPSPILLYRIFKVAYTLIWFCVATWKLIHILDNNVKLNRNLAILMISKNFAGKTGGC